MENMESLKVAEERLLKKIEELTRKISLATEYIEHIEQDRTLTQREKTTLGVIFSSLMD